MSWVDKNKGAGPWPFEEQANKFGYLNNPRWTDAPGPPVDYTGREDEEPQVWDIGDQNNHIVVANEFSKEHKPCGHWHKKPIVPVPSVPSVPSVEGYIISGAYFYTDFAYDFFVMLVDASEVKWAKRFWLSSDRSGYGRSIVEVSDGVVVAGVSIKDGIFKQFVIKLSKDTGSVIWSTVLDAPSQDEQLSSITKLSDGGLVTVGWTYRLSVKNLCIIKLTSGGAIDWGKTIIGTTSGDIGFSVIATSDGGFVLAGVTEAFAEANLKDGIIIKFTSGGTISWAKRYNRTGTSDDEVITDIQETSDGGFIAIGYTREYGVGYGDILIIKLTSSGNITWTLRIVADSGAGDRLGCKIREVSDGYVFIGYHPDEISLTKITSAGNWSWSKKITNDAAGDMYYGDLGALTLSGTGIAFAGITYNGGISAYDILLANVNLSGTIPGCGYISNVTPTTEAGNVVANNLSLTTSPLARNTESHNLNELSPTIGLNNYCLSDEFFAHQLTTNLKNLEPYDMIKLG